jgi:hypothetical protein
MRAPKAKRAGIEIKHEMTSRVPMFPRPCGVIRKSSFNAVTRTLNVGQGTRLHGDNTLELVALRNAGALGFHVPETGKDRKVAELQWLFLPDGGGCLPADNRVALWGAYWLQV